MMIQSIRLHNFGAYRGEQAIIPAVSEGSDGFVTLVGGLNGVGKTSLLEAVMLALYGARSPAARESGVSYSRYLKGLVNRDTPTFAPTWVEIAFDIDNVDSVERLRVRRTWAPTPADALDKLEVYRDGELDKFLSSTWSTYVEELIPVGLAGLFFFDGEKISALAGNEHTPEMVRQSMRSLLGLDLIDRAIDDLNTVIRRNSSGLDDSQPREMLHKLMNDKRDILVRQDVLRQNIAQIHTEVAVLERKLQAKNEEYLRGGGDLLGQRHQHVSELQALREQTLEQRASLVALAGGALPLLLVRDLLAGCAADAKEGARVREAQAALPLLAARNRVVKDWIRHSKAQTPEPLIDLLDQQERELQDAASKSGTSALSPAGEAQLSYVLSSLAEEMARETAAGVAALHDAERLHDELQRRLGTQLNEEALADLLGEISLITQETAAKEQQRDACERDVSRLYIELEKVDREIELQASQLVSSSDTSRIVAYAVQAQGTLRTFRTLVTGQKISHLADCILEAFTLLTRKETLVAKIELNPDTLSLSLFDLQGREIPKLRLASGEKQMLAVSILWGLAKASGRKLPIIVDTPMGRLDSAHRMNFVSKYLPNASHQVIVLSTDTEIVGPYLEALRSSVGKYYLLSNADHAGTTVTDGYFRLTEVASYDC
jgi:DNA sulfur modification protein DndD